MSKFAVSRNAGKVFKPKLPSNFVTLVFRDKKMAIAFEKCAKQAHTSKGQLIRDMAMHCLKDAGFLPKNYVENLNRHQYGHAKLSSSEVGE